MSSRYLFLIAVAAASITVSVGACATTEDGLPGGGPPEDRKVPSADASVDGAAESDDAGRCADCEYFPEACEDGVLCLDGPFGAGGFDPLTQINVIRGRSPNDVWIAGAMGAVAHFDGTSWARSDVEDGTSVRALWLRDSGEVSFAGMTQLLSRGVDVGDAGVPSPNGWIAPPPLAPPPGYMGTWNRLLVSGFAAPGGTWFWGATENICTVSFFCGTPGKDGTSGVWRIRFEPPGSFVMEGVIPSSLWQTIRCASMRAIHGASADALWAVGDRGQILRIGEAESAAPTVRPFNSQTSDALYGVWAVSESDAWAVGNSGIVRHYTGDPAVWDIVSNVPTTKDLYAVSGTSASDIWAVGDAGTVLHYDGTSWSRVKISGLGRRRPKLTAVWAPSPGHVWIGGQGVLLSLGGKP